MSQSEEEDLHPIFTKDPDEWLQYVYKQVSVITEDGLEHVGLVYTIDPVSESYVLVNLADSDMKMELIMGHAITSITILNHNTDINKQKLDNLFRPHAETSLSEEELKLKQRLLKSWLHKNRLPVDVSGPNGEFLTVAEALVIQPPYTSENCISTNEIILGKIQGLIKNMPADHDQW